MKGFRFECSFESFLYLRVLNAAQDLEWEVTRSGITKSGKTNINVISLDSSDEKEDGEHKGIDLPSSDNTIKSILISEEVECAREVLAKLWEENQSQALVLLMRNDLGLPSKDVAILLNLKPNTVDQTNKRAQEAMRKIRDSLKL